MAERPSLSKDDLLCPLCCEVFCLPVQLKCGHDFCKACLQKLWERKGSRECPVCRSVSFTERPPINLALKIASDSFQEQRTHENTEELCILHNEKLKLFCQNDEEPICVVCQSSTQHKVHDCCLVGEAAWERKTEVSEKLDTFHKHLKVLNKTKEDWEEIKTYIKTQADQTERLMQDEFEKLHQFLRREEASRLAKLRKEEDTKTQVMRDKLAHLEEKISELAGVIRDVEKATSAQDVQFLQGYKQTKSRIKYTTRDPECIRNILIDAAKHVGSLKFGIWREMREIVQCVPVTLDPNTAQPNLSLSDEFTSVRYAGKQVLPDNPERCSSRIAVLGVAGYASGKHSWTVEVGHNRDWYIGVVRESIRRKSTIFLNPAEGFLAIGLCNGDTYWAQTTPRTRLAVKRKPQRVMVELDYDKGKVTFLNAADMTALHAFKEKFTEKMFPYVSPGIYDAVPLKICPLAISRVQWPKSGLKVGDTQ